MLLDAKYRLCKVKMLVIICKAKKATRKQAKKNLKTLLSLQFSLRTRIL
jgi:hypothetical protein